MKKRLLVCGIAVAMIAIVGLSLLLVHLFAHYLCKTVTVAQHLEPVASDGNHPTNMLQLETNVWLFPYGGHLYFYNATPKGYTFTEYDHWLCQICDGEIRKIIRIEDPGCDIPVHIAGNTQQYLYYWKTLDKNASGLYCFDFESEVETRIYPGSYPTGNTSYLEDDGSLYIPLNPEVGKDQNFLHVVGSHVTEIVPRGKEYILESGKYSLQYGYSQTIETVIREDESGEISEIALDYGVRRTMIPFAGGLLVHNQRGEKMLYWISASGEVDILFQAPCLSSQSAVTVCGNDIFFSFNRYERYGELGQIPFENDELVGTYRINLDNRVVEKISDKIYTGLFNFDDRSIYACDRDFHVYRLDLNGNVIQTVMHIS